MSKPTYIIRLDDACPTMNWDVWKRVEAVIAENGIKPLVAVVPDNRDERLVVGPPQDDFWHHVRQWQARGWTIGAHGYQHRYFASRSRPYAWDGRTEFAGLPYAEQLRRLRCSIELFREEGVSPTVWVAPNHSFDRRTLQAVRTVGIEVVCDGYALFPYRDVRGLVWIPQQLWGFRPRRRGIWTICLHINRWTERDVDQLARDVAQYRELISDVPTVVGEYGGRLRSPFDLAFAAERVIQRRFRTRLGAESSPSPAEP